MSEDYYIKLPKLGESILSATVIRWFKQEGDEVNLDEPLLEVATDKVNSEIPSPTKGILSKVLVGEGQEIQVGQDLAILQLTKEAEKAEKTFPKSCEKEIESNCCLAKNTFYSPAVLRLAQDHNISTSEINTIPTSGFEGRLSKKDLEGYLQSRLLNKASNHFNSLQTPPQDIDIEKVPMSRLRNQIAENLIRSSREIPHATLIHEIDVTAIVKTIKDRKEEFFRKYQAKLTISSFIAYALSQTLKLYPFLNASLEKDTILIKRFVHLGIAVNVDHGVLVPVIQDCHLKNILEIAGSISDLSHRARLGQLNPNEIKEGTLTLTNFGVSGILTGIPIIRYPEVAIIGVGAIEKKVVVLEDNVWAARSLMHISLTFDHRVIDGIYGCQFLNALQTSLEKEVCVEFNQIF